MWIRYVNEVTDWQECFSNYGNKEDLIALACRFFKSYEGDSCKRRTWKITSDCVEEHTDYTHEEADTRLILHVAMTNEPTVAVG